VGADQHRFDAFLHDGGHGAGHHKINRTGRSNRIEKRNASPQIIVVCCCVASISPLP
jgi:hypothetical protein